MYLPFFMFLVFAFVLLLFTGKSYTLARLTYAHPTEVSAFDVCAPHGTFRFRCADLTCFVYWQHVRHDSRVLVDMRGPPQTVCEDRGSETHIDGLCHRYSRRLTCATRYSVLRL